MADSIVSGIYAILNTLNGKVYVGSAANFALRWHEHRYFLNKGTHHSQRLQNAWVKYGAAAFVFEIIEAVERTREALLAREQAHLDEAFATGLPYNICRVAGSSLGTKHTLETRANMSATRMGRKLTPEVRANMSAAQMGKKLTLKHRHNMAEALKGRKLPPETRAKMAAAKRGRERGPLSPEHRGKISAAGIGRPVSTDTRAKISAAVKRAWGRRVLPQGAA